MECVLTARVQFTPTGLVKEERMKTILNRIIMEFERNKLQLFCHDRKVERTFSN